MNDIEQYLENHDLVDVKMYTEFNHPEKKFKCYGHTGKLQHNWVTMKISDQVISDNCIF